MSYGLFAVAVLRTEHLSATFRRITFGSPRLADLVWGGLDQRVKLVLATADQLAGVPGDDDWFEWWRSLPDAVRPPMRTYTIAAHRPGEGEVDIDFAVHGDSGPLSSFARGARPGDRLLLVAPGPGAEPDVGVAWRPASARRLLCVGDETALPAIRNILGTLSADQTCDVLVEVPDASDPCALPTAAQVRITWVVRRPGEAVGTRAEAVMFGTAASPSSPGEADPDLWEEATGTAGDRYAWVAGEVAWVNRLRTHLATRGYTGANASFMGYWRSGFPSRG
ncbi:MAG TPA: siderophore-interacting protein [Propionicimonas sp.]|uniref:siderophore-interacting protein n=1 Tax=Propionicimonas sp. TaxID=1955623 RepID=UPI002F3F1B3E